MGGVVLGGSVGSILEKRCGGLSLSIKTRFLFGECWIMDFFITGWLEFGVCTHDSTLVATTSRRALSIYSLNVGISDVGGQRLLFSLLACCLHPFSVATFFGVFFILGSCRLDAHPFPSSLSWTCSSLSRENKTRLDTGAWGDRFRSDNYLPHRSPMWSAWLRCGGALKRKEDGNQNWQFLLWLSNRRLITRFQKIAQPIDVSAGMFMLRVPLEMTLGLVFLRWLGLLMVCWAPRWELGVLAGSLAFRSSVLGYRGWNPFCADLGTSTTVPGCGSDFSSLVCVLVIRDVIGFVSLPPLQPGSSIHPLETHFLECLGLKPDPSWWTLEGAGWSAGFWWVFVPPFDCLVGLVLSKEPWPLDFFCWGLALDGHWGPTPRLNSGQAVPDFGMALCLGAGGCSSPPRHLFWSEVEFDPVPAFDLVVSWLRGPSGWMGVFFWQCPVLWGRPFQWVLFCRG